MVTKPNAWSASRAPRALPQSGHGGAVTNGLVSALVFALLLASGLAVLMWLNLRATEQQHKEAIRLLGACPDVVERGGCEYCRPELYPKRGE